MPTTIRYYLTYEDRCGVITYDTIQIIPGFEATIVTNDVEVCGYEPISINVSSPPSGIIDDIITNSTGNGTFTVSHGVTPGSVSTVTYTPDYSDFANNPTTIYLTSQSGRCVDVDTADLIFHESPTADAGPDITTTADSFVLGGTPSGICANCTSFNHDWSQGVALNDSTAANPMAYKNSLISSEFVLRVTDPTTGCFGLDTAYVYTSLDNDDIEPRTKCLPNRVMLISWTMIPSVDHYTFGVESSVDLGETWQPAGELFAGKSVESGQAVRYAMHVKRPTQSDAIYRWYSNNARGERKTMMMLDDADCDALATYSVYPNPFTNTIDISIETETVVKSNYTIQVLNQYGQLLVEKEIKSQSASNSVHFNMDGLHDLSKGVYYLHIQHNQNNLYSTMIVKTE